MRHGDHNVYFKGARGDVIPAGSLEEMRAHLCRLAGQGVECFLTPHHIGYLSGCRGIRWEEFTPEFSPVVEAFSSHGLAESDDGPFPYLIPMGPRDGRSTAQHDLAMGHAFGLIGSTDHHGAHPGSYGQGRVAVWSRDLSRDGIWEAIASRRTYALTGDCIALPFSINGRPLGSILPASPERRQEVSVVGGAALDYVEVIHNNRVLHRWNIDGSELHWGREPVKVLLELGWGEQGRPVRWDGDISVVAGRLLSVKPRFRGDDTVEPDSTAERHHAVSSWERVRENALAFTNMTWDNPTPTTSSTRGLCLEIVGEQNTQIQAQINGRQVTMALGDLPAGSQVGYLGGFHTPAYCFHRAVHRAAYTCLESLRHHSDASDREWYYVRVRQRNGQRAWSSPIWVEAP
jgi:hypothetical protein